MLHLLVLVSLLFAHCLCVPVFTSVPMTDIQTHVGRPASVFCSASGSGTVTVVIQLSLCGNAFTNVASGTGSAFWQQNTSEVYNCAQIQCQATDASGTITSNPVVLVIEHDVGSVIQGACAALCATVQFSATSSGSLGFTGFNVPRSNVNFQFYHNGFAVTFNFSGSTSYTVSNWVATGNETTSYIPSGSLTYRMSGITLNVQNFEMHGSTFTTANPVGRIASATWINVTDCVTFSLNGVIPSAGYGTHYQC